MVGELCRPWLNDLEHDRSYPSEDAVIEQLTEILNISSDILYFYGKRAPGDVEGDFDDSAIRGAYCASRNVLNGHAPSASIGICADES
jgi:hypothetical protein